MRVVIIDVPDEFPIEMQEQAVAHLNGMRLFASHKCEDDGVAVVVLWDGKNPVPISCLDRQMFAILERFKQERLKEIMRNG
jgi:hypothetical protein